MAGREESQWRRELLDRLHYLRVEEPRWYEAWYQKWQEHRANPGEIPFPAVPDYPCPVPPIVPGILCPPSHSDHAKEKEVPRQVESTIDEQDFPGPLVRDRTFPQKNQLLQFCQKQIERLNKTELQGDDKNLILIWKLLCLLVRQNGHVIGCDVAGILLEEKGCLDGSAEEVVSLNCKSKTSENQTAMIAEFQRKLGLGYKVEALDYAMDNGLWALALLLSSKMSPTLHRRVLYRQESEFLPVNSPLKTLDRFLCGNPTPYVPSYKDDKCWDFKSHLAILVSNIEMNPKIGASVILTFGKSLVSMRKLNLGALFCFLVAESVFGLPESCRDSLQGMDSSGRMTEIYEFMKALNLDRVVEAHIDGYPHHVNENSLTYRNSEVVEDNEPTTEDSNKKRRKEFLKPAMSGFFK